MAATTSTIGTDKDYTTIAGWEDAQDGNPDNQDTGLCEAEVFAAVVFDGGTYTATNYPHLTAKSGAEHDGRAHEVSGAGNARIESAANAVVVHVLDNFPRVSWLEVKGPGNNAQNTVFVYNCDNAATPHVHHCIIHNNYANTGAQSGFYSNAGSFVMSVYRNIIYGHGHYGLISYITGLACHVFCNTVFYNGDSGNAGVRIGDANTVVQNNASFANLVVDFNDTTGVMDYNASSDTTGDDEGANSIANLTTANQFIAPTTTWAETDLLHKAGADIIGEGLDMSADVATYPEINVSIRNGATRATISGAWDIGADQYEAAATGNRRRRLIICGAA